MNRIIFGLLTALCLITETPLKGEVDKVVLKWNPGFCNESCANSLDRRLSSMSDVAEVRVENGSSQAILRWRPNKIFSYERIDAAMRFIGVRLMQVFVTVRGTISHADKSPSIISIGDNTPFYLLSPTQISNNQAAALQNIQSYRLTPEMLNKLMIAEQDYKVVTIEGLLLLPERGPPLHLIIQNISIPPSLNPEEVPENERLAPRR